MTVAQKLIGLSRGLDPTSITGLKVWIDFSDVTRLFTDTAGTVAVTADGDKIGCAKDKSGNSNNVTDIGFSTVRPAYKTNVQGGRSVARFDGVQTTLLKTAFGAALTQPTMIYAVSKVTGIAGIQNITDGGVDGLGRHILGYTDAFGGPPFAVRMYAGASAISDGFLGTTAFRIYEGFFNGASSTLTVDGAGSLSPADVGAQTMTGLAIGSTFDGGGQYLNGDVAEVLIYNTTLSAADKTRIRSYLGSKYGIVTT